MLRLLICYRSTVEIEPFTITTVALIAYLQESKSHPTKGERVKAHRENILPHCVNKDIQIQRKPGFFSLVKLEAVFYRYDSMLMDG